MKNLVCLFLFVPFASFAQKFEVSGMVGPSVEFAGPFTSPGLSTQASVTYRLSKRFSVGAFGDCEAFHSWGGNVAGNKTNYLFGIVSEYHAKHFFMGLSAGGTKLGDRGGHYNATYTSNGVIPAHSETVKWDPSFLFGAHIGYTENLSRHFSLKQQLGLYFSESRGNVHPDTDVFYKIRVWRPCLVVGVGYRW